jgi:hypothetical protein
MENEDETFIKKEDQGFSRFYRFSKWFVTNRELLKKIGYGVFIAFDAALVLFVVWHLLDAYVISYSKENAAVTQMVSVGHADLRAYTQASAADPLILGSASTFSLGEGKYDFYATLANPNEEWWADFTYSFTGSAEEEEEEPERVTGFILPGEEKPLVALGVELEGAPRGANLVVTDLAWHRVDRHLVGDYAEWYRDRFNLLIEDAAWNLDTEKTPPTGSVGFSVTNDSPFSYYDPVFYTLLKRGSRVVGVNRTRLSDLNSYETRMVDLSWFGAIPDVSQVEVIPEINIFDVGVYKPLEGETTQDTRTRVFDRRR